jgi:hypothetical protein
VDSPLKGVQITFMQLKANRTSFLWPLFTALFVVKLCEPVAQMPVIAPVAQFLPFHPFGEVEIKLFIGDAAFGNGVCVLVKSHTMLSSWFSRTKLHQPQFGRAVTDILLILAPDRHVGFIS